MARDRLGFYSPFLTASQKAELRQVEEGLEAEDEQKVDQAILAFLRSSFGLTRDALLEFRPALDLDTLIEIRDNEEDSDLVDQFRQFLWNGDELSPFARRLLAWHQGVADDSSLRLSLAELNNYLGASVDFYEGMRPLGPSREIEVRPLNLLEPAPIPSLELPEVIEELEKVAPEREEEAEPVSVIRLAWNPEAEFVPDQPPSGEPEDTPVVLKLLWEKEPPPPESDVSPEGLFPEESVLFPEPDEPDEPVALLLQDPAEGESPAEEAPVEQAPLGPPPTAKAVARGKDPDEIPSRTRGSGPREDDDGMELIATSAVPLSPIEQRKGLVVKKKYLGYGKNSDGVMGYCGQLTLSRFDDSPLDARLECSNPLLFLSSSTPAGKAPVVTYWMPPAAFPQPGGHLTINLPDQHKVLSVGSLFPQSRTDFLNGGQVLLLMLAPSILGLLYFTFVYLLSASAIVAQVKEIFPEAYVAALAGSGTADFRSQGVGLYQLEVVPASESLQLIWAALIWICPLLAAKFFRHLSRSRQRGFGAGLAAAMLLPSLGLFAIWNVQKSAFPLFYHPDFSPLDLRDFLPWSVPLNLAVAVYLFLSVHGAWDRLVASRELRFLLPIVLFSLYLVIGFVVIFGRSWLA